MYWLFNWELRSIVPSGETMLSKSLFEGGLQLGTIVERMWNDWNDQKFIWVSKITGAPFPLVGCPLK
jgi:hypothetical protein